MNIRFRTLLTLSCAVFLAGPLTGYAASTLTGPQAVTLGTSAQYTSGDSSPRLLLWSVNRVVGGDPRFGTISSAGLYSAPNAMPPNSTITIAASDPAHPWTGQTLRITLQAAPSGPAPIPSVVAVDPMGTVLQNPHIQGRDGTWSAAIGGKSYWSFNDTAMNAPNAEGQYFISNSRSWTDNLDASNGIHLDHDHVDATGMPTEFMPFTAEEAAFNAAHGNGSNCSTTTDPLCGESYAIWPGPVIPVPDSLTGDAYLFYSLLLRGGPISGWKELGIGIAWQQNGAITRPLLTPGSPNPTLMWHNTSNYSGGGLVQSGYLYMSGCGQSNLFGYPECNMGRVPLNAVLDLRAWTYYNATTGQWVSDSAQATPLFIGGAGGNSLFFNPALNEYMVVYSQTYTDAVLFRVAPTPWGPWSGEQQLFTGVPTIGANNAPDYAAQPHPEFQQQNGLVQYVTYVQDDSDLGFLGQNLQLVRVTFAPHP